MLDKQDIINIDNYFENINNNFILEFCNNNLDFTSAEYPHEDEFLIEAAKSYLQHLNDIYLSSQNFDVIL